MMFSRDAMTASATEAATPPKMPTTTNSLLRLGVTIPHSPPSPRRAARASEPVRDSGAQTKHSTAIPRSRAQSTAIHSERSRPWRRSRRSSCLHRLTDPTRLPLPVEDFSAHTNAQHSTEEQHVAQEHREQRPQHTAGHRRFFKLHDRRALVQRIPPLHRIMNDRHVDDSDDREQGRRPVAPIRIFERGPQRYHAKIKKQQNQFRSQARIPSPI